MPSENAFKISVIVPVFNGEATVGRCVRSLLRQRPETMPFEIILVDDVSTDGTQRVCRDLALGHPGQIIYERLKEHSGVSVARNVGIAHSSGQYLAFVDCDDTVSEDYLWSLAREMEPGVQLVCCGYYAIVDGARFCQKFFESACTFVTQQEKEEFFLRLMNDDYGQPSGQRRITAIGVPWAKLFSADVIREHGLCFVPDLTRRQDNIFVAQYASLCAAIRYMDRPLYFYSAGHSQRTYDRFPPEVYRRFLAERELFFQQQPAEDFGSVRLRAFRCAEKAVMLNSAVKYLVARHSHTEAVKEIRALSDAPEFQIPPGEATIQMLRAMSRKQRAYMALYGLFRAQRYALLDWIWRAFLRSRGRADGQRKE